MYSVECKTAGQKKNIIDGVKNIDCESLCNIESFFNCFGIKKDKAHDEICKINEEIESLKKKVNDEIEALQKKKQTLLLNNIHNDNENSDIENEEEDEEEEEEDDNADNNNDSDEDLVDVIE